MNPIALRFDHERQQQAQIRTRTEPPHRVRCAGCTDEPRNDPTAPNIRVRKMLNKNQEAAMYAYAVVNTRTITGGQSTQTRLKRTVEHARAHQ